MQYVIPPFELGETFAGKDDAGTLINLSWLGQIFEFPANQQGVSQIRGSKKRSSGRQIRAVALRNESGIALLPKRLARLVRTAGYSNVEAVDGYSAVLAEKGIVFIDEFLPAAGVADDDIFWGIISGPTTVLTSFVNTDFNGDIAVGAELVAATGATTQDTDAGKVSNVTLPGDTAGTQAFQMAHRVVGVALSARTTDNTNADLLINACIEL